MSKFITSDEFPSWTTNAAIGEAILIRFADHDDAGGLQRYFRSLSRPSRHDRFMGGISELSVHDIMRMTDQSDRPGVAIVAEIASAEQHIIGEAYCAFDIDDARGEFAISVEDRWQRRGLGLALLTAVESCAGRVGLKVLCAETMQSNDKMKNLAVRAGFAVGKCPGDWSVSRLEKKLSGTPLSSASPTELYQR